MKGIKTGPSRITTTECAAGFPLNFIVPGSEELSAFSAELFLGR
jgi:hypothetical protein